MAEKVLGSNHLSQSGLPLNQLRCDLLDYLSTNDKAHFKSQHKDDPELTQEDKRRVAEDILERSPSQFLSRFGNFIHEDHLKYFSGEAGPLERESYEIGFHLQRLHRFHCKATHDVDVKNRRYDALQKMIAGGSSYFSEDEMRQRNPYLYEQLVGQYLTEEERKERETPDLGNISFVNLLLMKISRDETKELKTRQEMEESGIQEESSESSNENEEEISASQNWNQRGTWGETAEDIAKMMDKRKKKNLKKRTSSPKSIEEENDISEEERQLLMEEFVSTMYNSFIDGKDTEFDYSQVDSNPDYDCVDVREKDEEEKYFDAETPEDEEMEEVSECLDTTCEPLAAPPPPSIAEKRKAQEEEEDTLDAFMKTVQCPVQTSDLTAAFQNLCHQSRIQPSQSSRVLKKSHVIKINLKRD